VPSGHSCKIRALYFSRAGTIDLLGVISGNLGDRSIELTLPIFVSAALYFGLAAKVTKAAVRVD
jgi:hypothetical protein